MNVSILRCSPIDGPEIQEFQLYADDVLSHDDKYIRGVLEHVADDRKLECIKSTDSELIYHRDASFWSMRKAQHIDYTMARSASGAAMRLTCGLPHESLTYIIGQISELKLNFSNDFAEWTYNNLMQKHAIKVQA